MNAEINAFANMCAAVVACCEAHNADWAGKLPFDGEYADFKALYDTFPSLIALQDTTHEGSTAQKNQARELLLTELYKFTNAMAYYAASTNQPLLQKIFALSPSEIAAKTDEGLAGYAEKVINEVNKLATAARDSIGLTAAAITLYGARRSTYFSLVGEPEHKITEAQRGTVYLQKLVDDLRERLSGRLDRAITMLEADLPDFAFEYRGTREINDPGYQKRALTVRVRSGLSGQLLEGASVVITPGGYDKLTGPGGSFYIDTMPDGTYTASVTHDTHADKEVTFTIDNNLPAGKVLVIVM